MGMTGHSSWVVMMGERGGGAGGGQADMGRTHKGLGEAGSCRECDDSLSGYTYAMMSALLPRDT